MVIIWQSDFIRRLFIINFREHLFIIYRKGLGRLFEILDANQILSHNATKKKNHTLPRVTFVQIHELILLPE